MSGHEHEAGTGPTVKVWLTLEFTAPEFGDPILRICAVYLLLLSRCRCMWPGRLSCALLILVCLGAL
jgi:hypothetical protein